MHKQFDFLSDDRLNVMLYFTWRHFGFGVRLDMWDYKDFYLVLGPFSLTITYISKKNSNKLAAKWNEMKKEWDLQ